MVARIALSVFMVVMAAQLLPAQVMDFPDAVQLPIYGRMFGTIGRGPVDQRPENFGQHVYPLGDIDRDGLADWIVHHDRSDTAEFDTVAGYATIPTELLLYRGVRGGLPDVRSGVRLGSTEILARTDFFCSGDFDADGNLDLVISISIFSDTSDGVPLISGASLSTVAVFWGNPTGTFSLSDTTRLMCDSARWKLPAAGAAGRLNPGRADDLAIFSYGQGYSSGKLVTIPKITVFDGIESKRWGCDIPVVPSLRRWIYPYFSHISLKIMDHDGDGMADLVHTGNSIPNRSNVAVTYGSTSRAFLDTLQFDSVNIYALDGYKSRFIDVTGDGLQELVYTCMGSNETRIYAGSRGQRLRDQFGSGNDAPQPEKGWWYRPWATVWEPAKTDPGAEWVEGRISDAGDGNLDGISDIWLLPTNTLICYTTGEHLDSTVDAYVLQPGAYNATNMGDIDGSGIPSIGISYTKFATLENPFPGAIAFVRSSRSIPHGRQTRLLPTSPTGSVRAARDKTLASSIATEITESGLMVMFDVNPNHSVERVEVFALDGRLLESHELPAGARTAQLGRLPTGVYLISLVSGSSRQSVKVAVP